MSDTVPIIDIGPLLGGWETGIAAVAAQIGQVAREVGFFYIADHGVPQTLVTDVFAEMARYFARPLGEKQKLTYKNSKSNTGYLAIGDEYLDSELAADAKEAFQMNREIADDDPDFLAGKPFHAPNQWPADAPRFRPVMLEYFAIQKQICERLHGAFAIDLGLEPDFFAPYIDQPLATLRLLHYPPHPGTFDGKRYGASPHTDFGNLTILAQDDAGGLEVQNRAGDWIPAPPVPDTFLCNIGDCLMRWSNDIYRSTPHRVVNRSGRDRYSAAFFHDPNYDAPVECLPTCTDAARPPLYPATTGGAYLSAKLAEAFGYAGR
jgi:isopenicillin N synthase-like dioxygenase